MRHPLRHLAALVGPTAGGRPDDRTAITTTEITDLTGEAFVHGLVPLLWITLVERGLVEVPSEEWLEAEVVRCAEEDLDLPVEVFLAASHLAAEERNTEGLDQLAGVLETAADLDIAAVPLKGSSLLAGGVWAEPAMRTLYDLDILVPADRADDLVAALRKQGYRSGRDDATHHLPALSHRRLPLSVEIHLEVLPVGWQELLPASEYLAGASNHSWERGSLLLADPTTMVTHILAHAYLSDTRWFTGLIPLRAMLDLVRLEAHTPFDWSTVRARFERMGYGRIVDFHRAQQHLLVPAAGRPAVGPRARVDAAWALAADEEGWWKRLRTPILRWRELADEGRLTRYYRRQGIEEPLWKLRLRKLRELRTVDAAESV